MKHALVRSASKKLSPVSLICALGLLLAVPPSLLALPLPPTATIFAPGEPDPIGGAVVGGGVPVPFASGAFSGTLTTTVLLGDVTNPFGPGALTFTYLLVNSPGSTDSINRLTISSYSGFGVDASYQVPAAGLPPTLIDRDLAGDTIGFSFIGAPVGLGELPPGATAALMVLQTSATTFVPTSASVINASVASVASFAPTAIPEPSGLALLGLALVGWFRRRRS